jgi:hypothetical protein
MNCVSYKRVVHGTQRPLVSDSSARAIREVIITALRASLHLEEETIIKYIRHHLRLSLLAKHNLGDGIVNLPLELFLRILDWSLNSNT